MRRLVCFAVVVLSCLVGSRLLAQDTGLEELSKRAVGADAEAAHEALAQIRRMGPNAAPAVPALIKALESREDRVRSRAAAALAEIGPAASDAVGALVTALGDQEPQVRGYAAYALGRIGKPAEPAVDALVKAVFDSEPMVRRAAFAALRNIGPPPETTMPLVERILSEGHASVILPALATIAEQVQEGGAQLRELLKKDKIAYWGAVLAADLGPKAAAAVPELTALLEHAEPEVRLQALIALGEIGPDSAPAVPQIVDALETDPLDGVRFAAAFALGRIGQNNEEINRALVEAARGEPPMLKMLSLWALARINPDQENVVRYAAETIAAGLTSEDPQVRSAAARALADFEEHPDIVGPALLNALSDADPRVVGNALEALAALGSPTLHNIEKVLRNKELRHYATRVLYRMGPRAADGVPTIVQLMNEQPLNDQPQTDDDLRFRVELQLALAAIGPAASPAVAELIKSLGSDDKEVRGTAAYALGKIGAEAATAVPALQQRLAELEPGEKLPLLWALLKIQPGNREVAELAAPLLLSALDSDEPLIRAEAASAIGQLGELGRPAVERLRKLMEDGNPEVHRAVEAALQRLQPEEDGAAPAP